MTSLLHVIVVHHPNNDFAAQAEKVLRRAFGAGPEATDPDGMRLGSSIWSHVRVITITDKAGLDSIALGESDRVLWVLLVDYPMTTGGDWPPIMDAIGSMLDEATHSPDQSHVGILVFGEDGALRRLPDALRGIQGKPQAQLGEHRIGPHRLGLLALHRARQILGRTPGQNALKLFISHAKADGVFFADALNSAIKQVPELESWYDAEDLASGNNWKAKLQANASQSVFIAIRTEAYTQRPVCVDEFRWALEHGVPIVVVDALMRPDIPPATLPFASMPTVRVPDGNTHRVLATALREHLRLLMVETWLAESSAANAPNLPASAWRVWPRLPAFDALQQLVTKHDVPTPCCIVVAEAPGPEMNAAMNVLQGLRDGTGNPTPLRLSSAETFKDFAIQLSLAFQPPAGPMA